MTKNDAVTAMGRLIELVQNNNLATTEELDGFKKVQKSLDSEVVDLTQIFSMQVDLNDKVFRKKGITNEHGRLMESAYLYFKANSSGDHGPNSLTNVWLSNYLTALLDECRELREELLWKWWSKDTLDMQNIRVEIVDIVHFVVSLCIAAGIDSTKLMDIYYQKWNVNMSRQDNGYSKETKDETDNKGIV